MRFPCAYAMNLPLYSSTACTQCGWLPMTRSAPASTARCAISTGLSSEMPGSTSGTETYSFPQWKATARTSTWHRGPAAEGEAGVVVRTALHQRRLQVDHGEVRVRRDVLRGRHRVEEVVAVVADGDVRVPRRDYVPRRDQRPHP